jgi:cyclic-di-GMP phosphodiesterase TipF (flagellum assembly factor)
MSSTTGGSRLLNLIVLLAMFVTAVAFTVGLAANSGVDLMASAVAGGALFMVMASSHFVIMRELHSSPLDPRVQELEEAVIVLDSDLQRYDRLEGELERVQLLNDRVGRLERQFEDDDARPGRANVARLSTELQRLKDRHDSLRSEIDTAFRSQREQTQSELRSLEELVQGLAAEVVAAVSAGNESAAYDAPVARVAAVEPVTPAREDAADEPLALDVEALGEGDNEPPLEGGVEPYLGDLPEELEEASEEESPAEDAPTEIDSEASDEIEGAAELVTVEVTEVEEVVVVAEERAVESEAVAEEQSEEASDQDEEPSAEEREPVEAESAEETTMVQEPTLDLVLGEAEPLELGASQIPFDDTILILRRAIRTGQIAPYLSPIVALSDRKLRYGGAVPRMRQQSGAVPLTEEQWRVAREDSLFPRLDALILDKCVQFLGKLPAEARLRAIFVPLSAQTLLSSASFPNLVETLETNDGLAESIHFEFTQDAISELGESGLTNLKMLGKLGFCFSLKEISDFDLDYAGLRDYFFRFVKIDAATFLHNLEQAQAPVVAADMVEFLDRYDLKMIAEGVSDERMLDNVGDYGIEFAEGPLLGLPLPLEAEALRETEGADAA